MLAATMLAAGTLPPEALEAQGAPRIEVPVRLMSEGGEPVAGAAVRLVDRFGETVSQRVSDLEGRATIEAPGPGHYRVEVERIGYGLWNSDWVEVGGPVPERLQFVIPVVPVSLDQFEVIAEAENRCLPQQGLVSRFARSLVGRRIDEPMPEDRLLVYRMYESMVAAMTAVVENRPQAATWRYRVVEEEPILRADSRVPRGTQVDTSVVERGAPAEKVPPPEFLAQFGYLEPALPPDLPPLYHPLTPEALISEEFYATHCFTLVAEPDSAWAGLAFEPQPDRVHFDVRGVIWMDTIRKRPTTVEYHYTELARFMMASGLWQEAQRQAQGQRTSEWNRGSRSHAQTARALRSGFRRTTENHEHRPDPDERDFGGALRFGEAPHGEWDVVQSEVRWPGVRTSWTYDGHDFRQTSGAMHNSIAFMTQWTQILHYRRVEELLAVGPGGG